MDPNYESETTEVRRTDAVQGNARVSRQTVATDRRVDRNLLAARLVRYITGVIIALLALRVVLLLLGANQASPFVALVYALSGVFAWPFYGIFSYEPSYGQSTFDISSLFAILIYALIGSGIAKLLTLNRDHADSGI